MDPLKIFKKLDSVLMYILHLHTFYKLLLYIENYRLIVKNCIIGLVP